MKSYSKLIAKHPFVIVTLVGGLSLLCVIFSLVNGKLPNFTDPQLGFETRGTVISQRLVAWNNLYEATRPSGLLTANPNYHNPRLSPPLILNNNLLTTPSKKSFNHRKVWGDKKESDVEEEDEEERTTTEKEWSVLKPGITPSPTLHDHDHLSDDGFFCDGLSHDYSHVVVVSDDPLKSLLTVDAMHSMCELQKRLMDIDTMNDICETISPGTCCIPWSLPNYIALLNNKKDCFSITEEDVTEVKSLLVKCAQFYNSLQLQPNCFENGHCQDLPYSCTKFNAVYNILYYLSDTGFLPLNYSHNENHIFLNTTVIFLPIARSSAVLPYFHDLLSVELKYNDVRVSAMDFGLKNSLFDEYLIRDALLMGVGSGFMIFCMWMYTGSLFITLSTILAIGMSFMISYFVYTFIFNIKFFPFMNLLAIIVAVGIGADDVFIFYKMWELSKQEKTNYNLLKLVKNTFRQARISMFVTSFTTAAAFYSNYVSSITAINCFSIFAGTAVLVNFFLMITWLPACFVINENWCASAVYRYPWRTGINNKLRVYKECAAQVWVLSGCCLIVVVTRLKWVWMFVLTSIAISSAVVVLYYPKLRLPDSKDFHLFESNHYFEQYELKFKDRFWFEKLEKDNNWDNTNFKLPLRFVWGILPVDNGNYLEPSNRGTLEFDYTFDVASPESQVWLLKFCRLLRKQKFYQSTLGPLLPNCFIESLTNWMQRRCKDPIDDNDRTPCCESSSFPYTRQIFNVCVIEAMEHLYDTPADYFLPGVAGPKFSKQIRGEIKALVVEYDSSQSYSASFSEMNDFFKEIESWFQEQLMDAPEGLKGGWFVSELGFYDLQLTLSNGTIVSIGISMAVALAVVFLVSLNVLVSFYTIAAITCTIFVTVATLVLLGWQLNVLESIAITTAIGLSVDFCLHYGTVYRQWNDETRGEAVSQTLNKMGGPILMAALTTGSIGLFMLPSSILPYIKIGTFLIVVMGISWVYSTFFLMPLLSIIGPEKKFGQMSYSSIRDCFLTEVISPDRSDKFIFSTVFSDSTLSASSGTWASAPPSNSNEMHEMDVLSHTRSKTRRSLSSKNSCKRSVSQDHSSTGTTQNDSPTAASQDHSSTSTPQDHSSNGTLQDHSLSGTGNKHLPATAAEVHFPSGTPENDSPTAAPDLSPNGTPQKDSPTAIAGDLSPISMPQKDSPAIAAGELSHIDTPQKDSVVVAAKDESPNGSPPKDSPIAAAGDLSPHATAQKESPAATGGDLSSNGRTVLPSQEQSTVDSSEIVAISDVRQT